MMMNSISKMIKKFWKIHLFKMKVRRLQMKVKKIKRVKLVLVIMKSSMMKSLKIKKLKKNKNINVRMLKNILLMKRTMNRG